MQKIFLNLAEPAFPLPKPIQKKLCAFLGSTHRFPSNYCDLEKAIAAEYGVRKENVLLANGAHEAIDVIARVFGKRTLVFTPSYIEFVLAPERNGFKSETVSALQGKKFLVNPKHSKLKKATLVFLANPNNPFGYTSIKTIRELLENTKGVVAIDETYECFKGKSIASLVRKHKNLLVIGSFSKSLSLAGLRVGYIIGSKKLIEKIKPKLVMFRVASISAKAALLCLKQKKHFEKNAMRIVKARKAFEDWLEGKGFDVYRTDNNNALIRFSSAKKATDFTKKLERKGIIVLQGNGISTVGLNQRFVRITIGSPKEMMAVKSAILGFLR
ncbi:MAG: histidinol-phosphate transaminase [Candidatus Diapherotrites archaeon]